MKHSYRHLALFFAAFIALYMTHAQATMVVGKIDSLQLPAWLERGGLTVAATAGIELFAGDKLRTGGGARMLLLLNEGSAVRLGENAIFMVTNAERKSGVFTVAINVIDGAFRFTTRALSRSQPRNVSIRVGNNATIGIRGTDVWGRGSANKDIVCLIEGKIDVTGNNNVTLRLDQPLQFFQSTRSAPPEPVSLLDPKQLAIWAKETDMETGRGATTSGQWKITIGGLVSREAMQATRRALREAGYPVEQQTNNTLAILKMANEADAQALATKIMAAHGLSEVKVTR